MLKLILIVIILVLIISFFGISLPNLIHAPVTENNFEFLWQLIVSGWNALGTFLENTLHF